MSAGAEAARIAVNARHIPSRRMLEIPIEPILKT